MMIRRVAVMVFELSVLGTTAPVFGQVGMKPPAQITTTERVAFAPGGMIRIDRSYGDLNVEGWDQPTVEITVIKSMPYDYKPKPPDDVTKHLDGVRIATEHKSGTEMVISTILPARGRLSSLAFLPIHKGEVTLQYEIHAPRESKLVIHHGTGSVIVRDITGDIEATGGRGDIMLWLPPVPYSIDAKTKLGNVSSDFEGAAVSQYLIGQRFTHVNPSPSHRLYLRMGFGGITIKGILPQSEAPAAASVH
jgi:hypothetical protein